MERSRNARTHPWLIAAAVIVSVAAGLAIALGGLLRRPMLWLAVPPLVLVRLALRG